jgi:hypothetical protein
MMCRSVHVLIVSVAVAFSLGASGKEPACKPAIGGKPANAPNPCNGLVWGDAFPGSCSHPTLRVDKCTERASKTFVTVQQWWAYPKPNPTPENPQLCLYTRPDGGGMTKQVEVDNCKNG